MIRDPASKLDTKRMLEILTEVLEDSIYFGWENFPNNYLMIGKEIEQSRITWSDRQRMLQLCMTYSCIVLPSSSNKQKATNATRVKCCAPYHCGNVIKRETTPNLNMPATSAIASSRNCSPMLKWIAGQRNTRHQKTSRRGTGSRSPSTNEQSARDR